MSSDRVLGAVFVFATLVLGVGLVVATLDGSGPDPALFVVLVVLTSAMASLAVLYLGPARWHERAWRVALVLGFLSFAVFGLVALVFPGQVADPMSGRGPRTESGARLLGTVMLVGSAAAVLLPWWLGRRRR